MPFMFQWLKRHVCALRVTYNFRIFWNVRYFKTIHREEEEEGNVFLTLNRNIKC